MLNIIKSSLSKPNLLNNLKTYSFLLTTLYILSGCATQNVLSTAKTEISGSVDSFRQIYNSHQSNDVTVICVKAVYHYRKYLSGGYTYAYDKYAIQIPTNEISSLARQNIISNNYFIPRSAIGNCEADNSNSVTSNNIIKILSFTEYSELAKNHPFQSNSSIILGDTVEPGEFIFIDGYDSLLYRNENKQYIHILTEPHKRPGKPAALILLPFAAAIDLVTLPLQFFFMFALAAGH